MTYAELQVTSNYSFLQGASHPEELVTTAAALGLSAIAITDRNSLAGVVRAHVAAKAANMALVVGARLDFIDGHPSVLCLPMDRTAYGDLCHLLSQGRMRVPEDNEDPDARRRCLLTADDMFEHAAGQHLIVLGEPSLDCLRRLSNHAPERVHLALSRALEDNESERLQRLADLAAGTSVPLVATNDVHYHVAERRQLHDVMTAIRHHTTVADAAGRLLFANAERRLKSPAAMARLFRDFPEAVERSSAIAAACRFSLDALRHDYPQGDIPDGWDAQDWLEHLTMAGARDRYPDGIPPKVIDQIRHEWRIIGQLGYARYFLTVHDLVLFARGRGILCQGRGSAANSAVCFCLGITSVDPALADVLFERFISVERGEPPDIDVDFEHERREEVIQYLYQRYGRDHAALTASVTTWRTRSALRDVSKALGLTEDVATALAKGIWGSSGEALSEARVREAGLDPTDPRLRLALDLAEEIKRFPRHLSQHVGGFVLTGQPLNRMVPILHAAMDGRTTIEWDKDDLDALGLLKVDVLALGMLTCIRKAFQLIARHYDRHLDLATVPPEDRAVYDMLCKGDSVGVFQVESRAQMAMLPRLKPRCFYDLVIEVAIVRPGPIQGNMVHPYLRRRSGAEPVVYPSAELRGILEKTLGVPLFQEQAMRIAMVGAGFSGAEADALRRSMAAFRRTGQLSGFRDKFLSGMLVRGYQPQFAEACFRQIEGFGEYGFPESHAASFALLVYVSAWLKCRYPAVFACALLNSQPMGFYAPAQIIRDAVQHGARVLPVDVNASDWDCDLEDGGRALRLGLRLVHGLGKADGERVAAHRPPRYISPADLHRRTLIPPRAAAALARADAFAGLGLSRRDALWAVKALCPDPLPLFDSPALDPGPEPEALLPPENRAEEMAWDYRALGLSLKRHPLAVIRPHLSQQGYGVASALAAKASGAKAKLAGLVVTRQRPGSANGMVFLTLEDEDGVANLVIRPPILERYRAIVLTGRLVGVEGTIERDGLVIHIIARHLTELSPLLSAHLSGHPGLSTRSRDFH